MILIRVNKRGHVLGIVERKKLKKITEYANEFESFCEKDQIRNILKMLNISKESFCANQIEQNGSAEEIIKCINTDIRFFESQLCEVV
jgi:hypothetical protein